GETFRNHTGTRRCADYPFSGIQEPELPVCSPGIGRYRHIYPLAKPAAALAVDEICRGPGFCHEPGDPFRSVLYFPGTYRLPEPAVPESARCHKKRRKLFYGQEPDLYPKEPGRPLVGAKKSVSIFLAAGTTVH